MATTMATGTSMRTEGSTRVGYGILAGLAGGIIFGIMMQMMGIMTMIASMVGSQSAAVGWLMHLMIAAIFGLFYGIWGSTITKSWVVSGLIYGVILWVFGFLIVMPMMMGMPLFHFDSMTWMSLMGHMIYGFVTAWVFWLLEK